MNTQVLITIIGGGLALVSTLILLFLNTIKASINRIETNTAKRMDKQDATIDKIKDALSELKDSMRDRAAGDKDNLINQIEDVEQDLHRFQTQMISDTVTKNECQTQVNDLKIRISKLEDALRKVDNVTREQSLILARIEQAVKSL